MNTIDYLFRVQTTVLSTPVNFCCGKVHTQHFPAWDGRQWWLLSELCLFFWFDMGYLGLPLAIAQQVAKSQAQNHVKEKLIWTVIVAALNSHSLLSTYGPLYNGFPFHPGSGPVPCSYLFCGLCSFLCICLLQAPKVFFQSNPLEWCQSAKNYALSCRIWQKAKKWCPWSLLHLDSSKCHGSWEVHTPTSGINAQRFTQPLVKAHLSVRVCGVEVMGWAWP